MPKAACSLCARSHLRPVQMRGKLCCIALLSCLHSMLLTISWSLCTVACMRHMLPCEVPLRSLNVYHSILELAYTHKCWTIT